MKPIRKLVVATLLLVGAGAYAQNWATVTASNITDLNQNKLGAGQLCFLGTDQNDSPISFSVGGGGQVLKRAFCSAVASGAVTAFTVPNPANTQPAGIYYRVSVKDTSTGQEVLRYPLVTFSGTAFSFDNYAPTNLGSFAPLTGNAVSGNLSVSGNLAVTGASSAASYSTVGNNTSALVTTKRVVPNIGSPLVTADFTLTGGGSWGSTASITTLLGTDSSGVLIVTASGTGQSANPHLNLTFHDGTFPGAGTVPLFIRGDTNAPSNVHLACTTGPTSIACTFPGTPIAGNAYQFNWIIVGR